MLKQFTAGDLLHDDEHILLIFITFSHLDDVCMRNQLYDLSFLAKKFPFTLRQLNFINLFHSHDLLGLCILALVYHGELTVSQLSTSDVLCVEAEIVGLLFEVFDPVLDDLLISMIEYARFETFLLVEDDEPIIFGVFVIFDLVYVETLERYNIRWEHLITVVINIE